MTQDFPELIFPSSISLEPADGAALLLPQPGPNPAWTARRIIQILEPLTTESRRQRLQEVLNRRTYAVTVVLDDTHKAHNRAAVIRSCEAFGVQRAHFLMPAHKNEKLAISRLVSRGSHDWIDIVEHSSAHSVLSELKSTHHKILVTHPQGRLRPNDLKEIPRLALVMGNERVGVASQLREWADDTVAIPMNGFVESLNVSVTAAILLQAATDERSSDLDAAQKENIYARWLRNSVPRADEVLSSFPPC